MVKSLKIILLALTLLVFNNSYAEPKVRPAQWAREIIGTELDNFYKIYVGVYRSKQPEEDTFAMLQKWASKKC